MLNKKYDIIFKLCILIILEVALIFIFFSSFTNYVIGGVGENVTVITLLDVGNVYPEVLNVSIQDNAASFTLIANASKPISCLAIIRDWNGETDIKSVYAEMYTSPSVFGGADDNNSHYTNMSCNITHVFTSWRGITDDAYLAMANCTFDMWYYSNPGTWNCTVLVNDTYNWQDSGNDTISISDLLAIGLPATINYGTVNSTYVSDEITANVTNFGNVRLNLSLMGYAVTLTDGWAMNCSRGNVQNISVMYEKYNLTSANGGVIASLTEFQNGRYRNLTTPTKIGAFDLAHRQNDTFDEAWNSTYWRIYVPRGVAGTCNGNIIFGAVRAQDSYP